ncbi:MAG: thioesterase family protein [Pigmentiphaga sp.]|uniref:acyl-CoA thioesterase n=1 Tax=Pigmentiphaga sp. TaxID=1977564 RepID=UPI0029B84B3C|nr:thioesterase family protein [Pigmentiphaga sp.]MDX3906653.1 thioesterase family protein [Pigmentiphaga sp.]
MGMAHVMPIEIGFKHCDPAGIVFYPRYVEMLNDAVEHWLKHGIGKGFALLHGERRVAIPIVNLQVDFVAPSRLGEELEAELRIEGVGRTSLKVAIELRGAGPAGTRRVHAKLVLVFIDMNSMRPIAVPGDVREAMIAGRYWEG